MNAVDVWQDRYLVKDTPWDKGEASPGLVDFLGSRELTPGSVCVPGCGLGHDARASAARGFRALGVDIASAAAELSATRARSEGNVAEFVCGDFLGDDPPAQFDWVFEHTFFCAIQPAQRTDYVRAVLRWLKPAGHYLAVNYLIPDVEGPPFGTCRAELLERFSPYFLLREEWAPRSYPNRANLELMLLWQKRSNR